MSKPRKEMRYLNVNRFTLPKTVLEESDPLHLEKKMLDILEEGIYGISFSPYQDGQDPSLESVITQKQIAQRLSFIEQHTKWIRTFSCTHGNEEVPRIAHEKKVKVFAGVWLDSNKENNELEIQNMIRIANEGHVDLIAVGNEVLLREDLSIEELIAYIRQVKEAVPNIPVGYVDAYYMYVNYPEIVDEVDVLMANCYPFWEFCSIDISVEYMKKMYELVKSHSNGKPIVISETGWPTVGEQYGDALPSYENAISYFIQTQEWAKAENIDIFYFSSFDEIWKVNHEGEYGAYWGLFDKDGKYKFNRHMQLEEENDEEKTN